MYCAPLDGLLEHDEVGAKAANLSRMLREGLPVPPGFAIGARAFAECREVPTAIAGEIQIRLGSLRGARVMVRSSAVGEDSLDASFAGQLDSFICDRTVDSVVEGLGRCWASYDKESVRAYERHTGVRLRGMGVIVQELVEPDHAGVLFSRSHTDPARMLCEYVPGHGEKLVAGDVDPMRVECARDPDAVGGAVPFDLRELCAHALRLESLFDGPVDIEWAVRDGELSIVQCRPITTAPAPARMHWSNTNVNENYPGPITPLLYSIARGAYYHYFKNLARLLQISPRAVEELEPELANIIGAFGCRMYYNMTSIHTVIGRSPFAGMLRGAFDDFVGYQEGPSAPPRRSSLVSAVRFAARAVWLGVRLGANVRAFEKRADELALGCDRARDLPSMRACYHSFIELRMHGWYRASLADFFAMVHHGLLGRFCRRYFGEEHQGIHNTLVQAIPGLVSTRPVIETWRIATMIRADDDALAMLRTRQSDEVLTAFQRDQRFAPIGAAIDECLAAWGFRCSGELMLTEESFCEAPERFIDALRGYVERAGESPSDSIVSKAVERRLAHRELRRRLVRRRGIAAPLAIVDIALLEALVRLCFSSIAARERVRLKQALVYHRLKLLLAGIGSELERRGLLDAADDVLLLRHEELAEHLTTSAIHARATREVVAVRRREHDRESALVYPDDFSSIAGEYPTPERIVPARRGRDDGAAMRGLNACGGVVRGRARVLQSVLEIARIEPGDILVTRQTDPGWAAVFPLISGLVVERGGMLSHGAIVAREFGIPAIVGVRDATILLSDGESIELDADRGEVRRIDPSTERPWPR